MLAKRVSFSLLVIAFTAVAVFAQSNGRRPDWSSKKGGVVSQTLGPGKSDDADDKERIEGTWRAKGTFDFGEDIALFTFGAGKNANNGITVHSDNLFFVPVPSCLPAHGVWKRTGDRTFIGTDEGFCFDSTQNFDPAGKIKFKYSVKLNKQGTEFTGNLHVEGYDVNNNLVFSADATLQGKRMIAEAP
jgi:hypothetical protein